MADENADLAKRIERLEKNQELAHEFLQRAMEWYEAWDRPEGKHLAPVLTNIMLAISALVGSKE